MITRKHNRYSSYNIKLLTSTIKHACYLSAESMARQESLAALSFMVIIIILIMANCILPGCGDNQQFSNVSPYWGSWMDSGMAMGEEGSNLDNGGGTNHRARRLFQVQSKHTTLLQKNSHCCGLATRGSLQPAVRKLLQGRGSISMGTGSGKCSLSLSGKCWTCRYFK